MAAQSSPPREPTIAAQAFAAPATPRDRIFPRIVLPGSRSGWTGWTTSALVHGLGLSVVALIGFAAPEGSVFPAVDSVWSVPEVPAALAVDVAPTPLANGDPGGSMAFGATTLLEDGMPRPRDTERSLWPMELSPADFAPAWSADGLAADVGATRQSTGDGRGRGDGVGDGEGFFGIAPDAGRRIVYVVDNSRSMNHPHHSEAKTRFRRLKVELINSVFHMGQDQEFYIIFFSYETYPMPATTLQPATQAAKQRFLEWVARMDAGGGPTDPRKAMELALRLEPDIIYFLTDGEFDPSVNRRLTRIKQRRTTIHTFAFGERFGESVLEDLAKNNQGKYTFVP